MPEPVTTLPAPAAVVDIDGDDSDEMVDEELLVEEISIDGMCGVY